MIVITLGIGVIRNYVRMDKHFRIYQDGNYNRFTYQSKLRIDRDDFTDREMILIEAIEQLVFYGSTHIKRGQGIKPSTLIFSQTFVAEKTHEELPTFRLTVFDSDKEQYVTLITDKIPIELE